MREIRRNESGSRAGSKARPRPWTHVLAPLASIALGTLASPQAEANLAVPCPGERIERRVGAMGTWLTLEVEHQTRAQALDASEAALRAIEGVEGRLSTWRDDTELARLNAAPVGEAISLSTELAADLARARQLWQDTGGTFDPSVGRFVSLWGLRDGGRKPTDVELFRASAAGTFDSLELASGAATRRDDALVLEEGGFGKGCGLDAARAVLVEKGVCAAAIDLGGQVLVFGEELQPFAIAHPRERERPVVELAVASGSLATSGNAERAVVVRGERHGHILDPRTGRPAPDFGSVTVWAQDAMTADALSTALYVMGPNTALAFASDREGVEALVMEARPGGLRIRATAGLRGRLRALEDGLEIELVDGADAKPLEASLNER